MEGLSQILEAMDRDFSDIMTNITDWETRKQDRQQERPRWTKDDERKYRLVINKLLANSRRKLRELRNYQSTVKSLKISLATTQERIRNELSPRGNENMWYFTYATVFFLPLGFAVSVFSMQAAPSHKVLIGMVICAVVGLIITIVALITIQSILKVLEGAIGWVKLWLENFLALRRFLMRDHREVGKEINEEKLTKSCPGLSSVV
jgi:Mg2+ and Co2+ transporter CorA